MAKKQSNKAAPEAVCGCDGAFAPVLARVRGELPNHVLLSGLAGLFRIFADDTRVRILFSLFESEMCVCSIAALLGMTQSAISHQLRILRDTNLVGCRREGKTVIYFLADDHVRTIILQGFEHLLEGIDSEKGGEEQ